MPMYEFKCKPCDHAFETLVRGASDVPHCPKCRGTTLLKQFSVPRRRPGERRGGVAPAGRPAGRRLRRPLVRHGGMRRDGVTGRVVPAAEEPADLAVGGPGVLAGQVHREHPGVGHGPRPVVGLQGVGLDLEELADGLLDVLQGDGPRGVADRVAEGDLGQRQVELRLPVMVAWAIRLCRAPSSSRTLARRWSAT